MPLLLYYMSTYGSNSSHSSLPTRSTTFPKSYASPLLLWTIPLLRHHLLICCRTCQRQFVSITPLILLFLCPLFRVFCVFRFLFNANSCQKCQIWFELFRIKRVVPAIEESLVKRGSNFFLKTGKGSYLARLDKKQDKARLRSDATGVRYFGVSDFLFGRIRGGGLW